MPSLLLQHRRPPLRQAQGRLLQKTQGGCTSLEVVDTEILKAGRGPSTPPGLTVLLTYLFNR
jgi:hypothetical protein